MALGGGRHSRAGPRDRRLAGVLAAERDVPVHADRPRTAGCRHFVRQRIDARRLGLCGGATAGDGVVQGHRQGGRDFHRRRPARRKGPGDCAAGRFQRARGRWNTPGRRFSRPKSSLAAAKTAHEDARPLHERNVDLLPKGWISQTDFDNSKASYDAAESGLRVATRTLEVARANLAVAQRMLDDTIVRAPFAGSRHREGGAAGRDGVADLRRRRLHPHRHRHRSSTWTRSKSKWM